MIPVRSRFVDNLLSILSQSCCTGLDFPSIDTQVFCSPQEFHLSAIEQKIIQEIESLILKITYKEIVTEDGELMVTAAPSEAVEPSFDTGVKSYRIREGMGVTFHCRMAGTPLPKVNMGHRPRLCARHCLR